LQKRIKALHRKFPVGSFVTDQRKTFKITEHREPEESWTEGYAIWPFAGVRWIKSRKSWSKQELLISDKPKAVPDPAKKEASMASRVASRYMTALRIDQRRGEFPTSFWRDVTLRLCEKMKINPTKLKVLFRKGVPKLREYPMGVCRGGNHVEIDPDWGLPAQFEVLAHELRHAYQHQSGMLKCGRNEDGEFGNVWKGTWYSDELPWEKRPWEIDAQKYDRVGRKLYDQMKAKGEIPLSKQQAFRQSEPFVGPTLGDMDDVLSEDEFVAEIKERKKDKAAWLEKWRERYRTGWRGLKVSPEVGDLGRRG